MNIYSLSNDYSNFKQIELNTLLLAGMLGIDEEADQFSRLLKFGISGERYADIWTDGVSTSFKTLPDWPKAVHTPDVSVYKGATLILSEAAVACIRPILENSGELLPIDADGSRYYLLNILSRFPVIEELCELETMEGMPELILGAKNISWGDTAGLAPDLFYLDFHGFSGVYCNRAMKETIEQFELSGLIFSPEA